MRNTAKATLLVLLFGLICSLHAGNYTPREVIVKSNTALRVRGNLFGINELDDFLQSKSVKGIKKVPIPGMNYYVVYLNNEVSRNEVENLRIKGIEYVQVNNLNEMYITPNDSYFYSQELSTIGLLDAWDIERGNQNVTVAVIDSGILRDHPDLQGRTKLNYGEDADGDGFVMDPITGEYDPDDINGIDDDGNGFVDDICGWDFSDAPELEEIALGDYYDQDNDPADENYHGTHVSGIICANTNNSIGISGINWNSKILPVRAGFRTLEGTGYLQDDDAAAAIIYAVNSGAHVINLSWGDSEYSPIIADACEYAYEQGSIIVASAGNTPGPVLSYPARLANVISVGSIGRDDEISSFSTYGPDLDLVAPGEIILSTYSDGEHFTYDNQSGTSMAAPHVAGCISLLLSKNINLTYEEVRAKLLSTCDDLGESGKDDLYGYGKVNAYRLLLDSSIPDLKLMSPTDFAGYSDDFPIIGTVAVNNFLHYTLMYSMADVPTSLDWKDIVTHNNKPTEFTEEVLNDTLAIFEFLDDLPDSDYRIRLRVTDRNYDSFDVIRTFRLDRTAPIVNDQSVMIYPRYNSENMNFFLQALYNEKVVLDITCTDFNNNSYKALSTYPEQLQTVKLPNDLPEGPYFFDIKATNDCGISTNSQYLYNVVYHSSSINGWNRKKVGKGIVAIPETYDFNNNGLLEIVGMNLVENSYDDVNIYELGDSLSIVYSFNKKFWPYDIGNTNATGLEVLGLNLDTIYLHDTSSTATYPLSSPNWTETGCAGGYFKDVNLNGTDELLLLKNDSSERIWEIKKIVNGEYTTVAKLRNNSATNQRNSFVPSIATARLDYDNRVDILTADTEGDVMIYEFTESNTPLTPVWSFQFAVANTYYLETGDFTGDGTNDFVVVGYNDDPYNSNNNFWYLELFDSIGENQYEPISRLMFDRKQSKNSIKAADLDNDGDMELILGFSPDLYIVDYQNNELTPIWHGDCSWAYRIVPVRINGNNSILVNDVDENENVISVLYTKDDQYVENIPVPENFRLSLIDGRTSKLSWKSVQGAEYYNVYRTGPYGDWTIPVYDLEYSDTLLEYGSQYTYYVTACNSSQNPSESHSTAHKTIVPDPEPVLQEIKMLAPNQLRLTFDKKLSSDAYNIGFYSVNNDIGNPHSVNILNDRKRLLLRFRDNFDRNSSNYSLSISNLRSDMGVPVNMIVPFSYHDDMLSPFIEDAVIVSDKAVRIHFSEEMMVSDINDLNNYELNPPINDYGNEIVFVEYKWENQEKVAEITLKEKIVYSMEPYFVRLTNVRDLAGNNILNSRNLANFILEPEDIKVYPNPVYLEKSDANPVINFIALPENKKGNIYIYDTSGDLIYKNGLKNKSRFTWDLTNNKGKKVSSGIYFYIIRMGDYCKKGKVGVIN